MPTEGENLGLGPLTQAQQHRVHERTADQDRTLLAT